MSFGNKIQDYNLKEMDGAHTEYYISLLWVFLLEASIIQSYAFITNYFLDIFLSTDWLFIPTKSGMLSPVFK